jgi:hypothetical protein
VLGERVHESGWRRRLGDTSFPARQAVDGRDRRGWARAATGFGVVSGTVSKQAVGLRVLFHQGRPLELIPVEAGDGFPVNFYAGFYLEAGPGPAEDQLPMPAVDRVVALDQAGRQIAHCRLAVGPANTC